MSDTLTVTGPATAAAAEARTRDGGPVLEALDLRQTFRINLAVQDQKSLNFGDIGVFCGNK